jgi:hypothetical protein
MRRTLRRGIVALVGRKERELEDEVADETGIVRGSESDTIVELSKFKSFLSWKKRKKSISFGKVREMEMMKFVLRKKCTSLL